MNKTNEIAVSVKDLTKTFKIPLESHTGIKQKIINLLKGRKGYREFTPLNDISFEIKKGEFFGIVGRNGSGKSTLLKSIAGIYSPDKGGVLVNGKLIPFIELGVGFNAELSGRENVFLNGALLGFSHKEMEAMYDEIVDFAELHEFMEERLKNYSSGMQVRLAFSIAIRAKGDILLLDEVLAVGDEAFQRKCYDYFSELKREHKTVILVTHSMSAVETYCTRAMLIEDGKIQNIGKPNKIAAQYSKSNDDRYNKSQKHESKQKSSIDISIVDSKGNKADNFTSGDYMIVKASWKSVGVLNAGVAIMRADGLDMYSTNTYIENKSFDTTRKMISIRYKLNLAEGKYYLRVGLFGETDRKRIDFEHEGPEFSINRDKDDYRWGGISKLKSEWIQ